LSIIPGIKRRIDRLEIITASDLASLPLFLKRWSQVEIEIGSGNGHFLAQYARNQASKGLLGIELKAKRCRKIQKKISALRLGNVLIFHGNANQLLTCLYPGSIDAFHIYFPDPWPKTKQRKRRFIKQPLLKKLYLLLKPSGRIYFASDVYDYFLQVRLLALADGRFSCFNNSLPPEAELSLYAQKTYQHGQDLFTVTLIKKTDQELELK